jgi:hypothetical protein
MIASAVVQSGQAAQSSAAPSDTMWAVFLLPVALVLLVWAGNVVASSVEARRASRESRRSRTSDLFSEALDAIHEYQELPYRIRRRSDVSQMTPGELSSHAGDVQLLLDKYVTKLSFLDANVGAAYRELVVAARRESGAHMTTAWQQPRIKSDADMVLGNAFPRTQADGARERCTTVMQEHLDDPARRQRLRRKRR